jgi:hypothetical protein
MVAAFTATTRAAVGPSPSAPVGNLKVDYAATINLTRGADQHHTGQQPRAW